MHFDLTVFEDPQVVVLAALLLPAGGISKPVGCGLSASSQGREIAIRVGTGMIPRGEFCMVVARKWTGARSDPR